MPYTIQINKLGPVPPDGGTTLNPADPTLIRTQDNDRIIITVPVGTAFGNFDPGEIVGLNDVPYMLLGASMKSSLDPFTAGVIAVVGPLAPLGLLASRKLLTLIPDVSVNPIFLGGVMMMRDHLIAFSSPDPGPYTIITTLEPARDVGLISAYVRGRG